MTDKNIKRPLIATIIVLLIPIIGMILSSEWNWDLFDFVIMGGLIFSFGLFIEVVNLRVKNKNHKILLTVAIIFLFLYVWAELAVGLLFNFGS